MARAKKATANAKPKTADTKTRGQRIAEAQRRNSEFRNYLADMTSVQLTNFVKKLDSKTLTRVKRALKNAESKAAEVEKTRLQKEIDRLQKKMKTL